MAVTVTVTRAEVEAAKLLVERAADAGEDVDPAIVAIAEAVEPARSHEPEVEWPDEYEALDDDALDDDALDDDALDDDALDDDALDDDALDDDALDDEQAAAAAPEDEQSAAGAAPEAADQRPRGALKVRRSAAKNGPKAVRRYRSASRDWHVVPSQGGWSVQTASRRVHAKAATQAEAVEHARKILSKDGSSRVVVHDGDGGIVEILTVNEHRDWVDQHRRHLARERELSHRLSQLSRREREVLELLAEGQRAAAIADRLVVSMPTVRTQIRSILIKLEVRSQLEAVALLSQEPDLGRG